MLEHLPRAVAGIAGFFPYPLRGDELRAIKAWLVEPARMKPETDAFFISERRSPLSRKAVWVMIRDYGRLAGLPVETHPHMLRHTRGFALADQGANTRLIQDYLSGIGTYNTLSVIPRPIRHGSRGFGGSQELCKLANLMRIKSSYARNMNETSIEVIDFYSTLENGVICPTPQKGIFQS